MGFLENNPSSTAPQILDKLVTVDGIGSGLDADKLDGKESNEFATASQGSKADDALPATSYTASDILTKTKSVDGTGSLLDADLLDGMESSTGSTPNTIVVRDSSGNIIGNVLKSSVPNGTAPLNVESVTLVNNLNACRIDGLEATAFSLAGHTHDGGSPEVVGGVLTAPVFQSTTPTGSPPLIISSTTKVQNLNAEMLDGKEAIDFSLTGHEHDSTYSALAHEHDSRYVNIDGDTMTAGLTAPIFVSTTPTGTMPFSVTSTTKVNNLNADLLDGNEATAFSLSGHNHDASYSASGHNHDANYVNITGDTMTGNLSVPVLISSTPTGTAPFNITSTTKVTNLNADKLDNVDVDDTQTSTSYLWTASKIISYIAGVVEGMLVEQADVAVSINSVSTSETTFLDLSTASTNYLLRDVRLKCANPGNDIVDVLLYQLVNDVLTEVGEFEISQNNYETTFSLIDMFGVENIAGGSIKIAVISSYGTYAITGQYAYAKAI